jgi:hypothetical protein
MNGSHHLFSHSMVVELVKLQEVAGEAKPSRRTTLSLQLVITLCDGSHSPRRFKKIVFGATG